MWTGGRGHRPPPSNRPILPPEPSMIVDGRREGGGAIMDRPGVGCGVAILNEAGDLLLIQRRKAPGWSLGPAGRQGRLLRRHPHDRRPRGSGGTGRHGNDRRASLPDRGASRGRDGAISLGVAGLSGRVLRRRARSEGTGQAFRPRLVRARCPAVALDRTHLPGSAASSDEGSPRRLIRRESGTEVQFFMTMQEPPAWRRRPQRPSASARESAPIRTA